ncbi:hypothetical protein [Spirulina major]|uniref:hypothetical protein n=1 Tax=Spirulina major TaxID=270636 RepID=UPI00158719EE|nr:hypothetical protein [Spirulina major]
MIRTSAETGFFVLYSALPVYRAAIAVFLIVPPPDAPFPLLPRLSRVVLGVCGEERS